MTTKMASDTTQFIKNIQELICLLDNDFESFKPVLDQIVTEIVKNPKHTDAYVTFINNQLSKAVTRKRGLILLSFYLPFCTNEILEEETTAWLNNSLKYCKGEITIHDDAYKVIKPLLEICYGSPDLNRTVTSGTLNKIIENITKTHYDSKDSINALKCLETCLRIYSGSCFPFKTSIENFILTFVDCSTSETVVRLAGRCFLLLQQIGGGGTKGINHKESWKKQQLNLCVTIHSLMDELFESIIELGHEQEEINVAPIFLPKLPNGDKNKLTLYRVINLITFLQEMLLGAFPVAKSVYPKVVLNLITRGLSITRATLGDHIINDIINMSSNVYCIHKHLLKLLQALIVGLGCNLIPYGTPICKLVINNMKLTKPKDAGNVKAFCELRIVAYQTLSLWITTTNAASCINNFSDSFVPAIIHDITPYTTQLNLTVQTTALKQLSKKAKRKIQQDHISQSGIAKNYSPINKKSISSSNTYQNKICWEALNILESILINCGHLIKPVIHKQLQEFVVKTLFNIQRGTTPSPYDDIKCKIGLYKTLSTLVINHHWNMSAPIEYAVHLLSRGQSDSNPDIAFICSSALSNLNSFIHPPFATLQFPLDLDNLRNEFNLEQEKNAPSPVLELVESEEIEIAVREYNSDENDEIVVDDIPITEDEQININLDDKYTNNKSDIESIVENETDKELNMSTEDCNKSNEMDSTQTNGDNDEDQIEISDDDMEPLVIEEEPITNTIKTNDDNIKEQVSKANEISEKNESFEKKDEDVIDLEDEDMLNSFVDEVNE